MGVSDSGWNVTVVGDPKKLDDVTTGGLVDGPSGVSTVVPSPELEIASTVIEADAVGGEVLNPVLEEKTVVVPLDWEVIRSLPTDVPVSKFEIPEEVINND